MDSFFAIQAFLIFITILFLDPIIALEYPQEIINNLYPHLVSNGNSTIATPPAEPPAPPPHNSSSLRPALFVIGDSSVDCGTNNFLGLLLGLIGFPTAKISILISLLAAFAMEESLLIILTGSVDDMIRGVNYASAGAGIIFSSGSELGQHISLTQQIQQVMDTFQMFILSLGENAAFDLISNSIFYISIGSNDYIHYYLRNVSNVQSLYLPWSFNQFLAQTMKQEIQNLYNANVRNVVVMGLAPIGCAPYYLWFYDSPNGQCVEMINNMIMEFNFDMRFMVEELNQKLPGANIVFCDAFEGSMDIIKNHDYYGFNVTTDACCGLGKYRGWIMCISSDMACENASNHIWWDQFHPTDAVNEILADNVWSSLHSTMCYPMNLQEMISQNKIVSSEETGR
ncbi:UNVERIFIED_CONTAM: GDSL esterase/lipase [Sesamum radiatum]|uniref:GDSL esterase/lipase n=1 Tax=Sesamum radiatum TaxID=300843 RepID=A0AAW2L0T3_SESRA